jgi:type IV secretory pathway TrbL component
VALDPLTYAGGAGLGARLTGAAGKTVSIAKPGRKAIAAAIKEIETGASISDNALRRYAESAGYTAEKIASATDKRLLHRKSESCLARANRLDSTRSCR